MTPPVAVDHTHAAPTARESARDSLQWTLTAERRPGWHALLHDLHAGFFHDPRALNLGAPAGQPIVAVLRKGARIEGVAVGLRYHCRLSAKPRHAYFPSLPRIREGVDMADALDRLRATLTGAGVSDLTFDSFDAAADFRPRWGAPSDARNEYRVSLAAEPADILKSFSSHHARHIRRGEREAWRIDVSLAQTAAASMALVGESASTRAAERGHGFAAAAYDLTRVETLCDEHWGAGVHSAYAGDTLLSAALIGWGGTRAFYLAGGSTKEGYARGAATWLHWRAMLALRDRGITLYNFGGAPAAAEHDGHPSHGLHRFKTGFGADVVRLGGVRWSDASIHSELHRAAQRFTQGPSGGHAA